jgi:4-hydroxybenzoate polyprenyltransferase
MFPLLKLLRVKQWTKNGVCLAGVLFSGMYSRPGAIALAAATALAFCLASSSIYIWNDIHDRKRDRSHPKKCGRPLACGEVSVSAAAALGAALGSGALLGGLGLGWAVFACIALYMVNNGLYSVWLKHVALLDVLCIVFGFVLRLVAGIYVVGDIPTTWIILCSFFLASFLGFSKRRAELNSISGNLEKELPADSQRPVLDDYTVDYLDFLVSSSATMAIIAYALFATTSGKNPTLIVTLPIVYYAIMHYKRLVMVTKSGEEPELILLKDPLIIVCIAAWIVLYMLLWKLDPHFIR